jgi:hypothetical protein
MIHDNPLAKIFVIFVTFRKLFSRKSKAKFFVSTYTDLLYSVHYNEDRTEMFDQEKTFIYPIIVVCYQ